MWGYWFLKEFNGFKKFKFWQKFGRIFCFDKNLRLGWLIFWKFCLKQSILKNSKHFPTLKSSFDDNKSWGDGYENSSSIQI